MIGLLTTLGAPIIKGLFSAVDQAVEDKDQANAIKARLEELALAGQLKELQEAASIIRAEAGGESWLQRNWRPLTMLTFVALVVAKWLGFTAPGVSEAVELELMRLIQIGLGGYVVGRSAEKGIKLWKGKSDG